MSGTERTEALEGDLFANNLADGVEGKARSRTFLTSAVDKVGSATGDGITALVTPGAVSSDKGTVQATVLPESDRVDTGNAFLALEQELGGDLGLNPSFVRTKDAIASLDLPTDPDAEDEE